MCLVEALLFGRGPCESRDAVARPENTMYIKGNSVDGKHCYCPGWHDRSESWSSHTIFKVQGLFVDSCSGSLSVERVLAAIPEFPDALNSAWHGPSDSHPRTLDRTSASLN